MCVKLNAFRNNLEFSCLPICNWIFPGVDMYGVDGMLRVCMMCVKYCIYAVEHIYGGGYD